MKRIWTILDTDTEVLMVPGGMVLRSSGQRSEELGHLQEAMVFVPGKPQEISDWIDSTRGDTARIPRGA